MKKGKVINTHLSKVISDMGHMDRLGLGDAGMPVPENIEKIDLAVECNLPSFIAVLKNILVELKVQEVILADEIKEQNPDQLAAIQNVLEPSEIKYTFIPHEQLKKELVLTKGFVRTGEMTPFSNVILVSGVTF